MSTQPIFSYPPSPREAAHQWTRGLAKEVRRAAGPSERLTPKKAETITGMYADNVASYFERTGRSWVYCNTIIASAARYARKHLERASGGDGQVSLRDIQLLPADMIDDLLIMRGKEPVETAPITPEVPASGEVLALEEAVANANASGMPRWGKSFDLHHYPATVSKNAILREIGMVDEYDMDDAELATWFEGTSGASAVASFAGDMRSVGKDEYTSRNDGDDYEPNADQAKKVFDDVAASVEATFSPVSKFASVEVQYHPIYEDGDTEYQILMAREKNGDWLVLSYQNWPF